MLTRRVATGLRETGNSDTHRPENKNFLESRAVIKFTVRMLSGWVVAVDQVSQNLAHSYLSHS